ncbi:MAG: TetR/AcrR family transcriptional regulator [Deltaproteobacteria bacterium]
MQHTRSSNQSKRNREAAILEAACAVIREKGFHQARIIDISRRAGISYGLVYHYFRSKADLFEAITRAWWDGIYSTIDSCKTRASAIEDRLGIIVNHFLNLYDERPNLVHVFITEISRSSANLTPAGLAFFKRFFDKTEGIMAQAQSAGTLRSDVRARYLTYIFLGSLESFLSTMVLENQPFTGPAQKKRIAGGLLEVFFNGAGSRQG